MAREPVAEQDSTSVAPTLRRRAPRFLVNRDFARLWYGQAISTVGDYVFDTTVTIWVATQLMDGSRWAPAAVGGVMISALLAIMVIGPAAGVFVDRWNKRRLMLRSEVVRGILVASLLLLTLLPVGTIPVWLWLVLIYAIVFVINAAGQFFNPARFATIGDIVSDEADRTKAFGLGQATSATAAILGPPLAAPVLLTAGIGWALFANAVSYLVSFFAIRSVNFPPEERTAAGEAVTDSGSSWWSEFTAGLRMFAKNRFLVALLIVFILSSLGTGSMTALLVFFVGENLHAAPQYLGLMTMVYGVGSIIGALLSGRLAAWMTARRLTWLGLMAGGLLFALYARQTSFVIAAVVMFVVAVPVAAMNASLSPQLIAVTPREFLGRTVAVITPISMAATALSVIAGGWLASTVLNGFHGTVLGLHIGRIDTIFMVASALVITAGIYGFFALPPSPPREPMVIPNQRRGIARAPRELDTRRETSRTADAYSPRESAIMVWATQ
ncbi:MFS transporter [Hamadaea sp. NPDC051192]|uniref:MFS transporter n=1 Tax=Hamadaea sp. NPDC051192 TaxID=3154940 RepID=UPI003435486C